MDGRETESVDFGFVGQYEAEGHTLNSRLRCQGKGTYFHFIMRADVLRMKTENTKI